jgi:hypothetical protein
MIDKDHSGQVLLKDTKLTTIGAHNLLVGNLYMAITGILTTTTGQLRTRMVTTRIISTKIEILTFLRHK